MATRPRHMSKPRLSPAQRRALEALAASGLNGATTDGLMATGFRMLTIRRLVRRGFVAVVRQRMKAGGKAIDVMHVHITDAGRNALAGAADAPAARR
jgi:hypothetical protein